MVLRLNPGLVSEMPFKKFVEIGRVALLNDGPNAGKIAGRRCEDLLSVGLKDFSFSYCQYY